jgi:uncharacterized damage-inducible protein DinB
VNRPDRNEYAPYYATYVDLVPDGDIHATLAAQLPETLALLRTTPADRETWRYADGKWSVREAVGHLVETERMFIGRALWIARAEDVELPGMDQDAWVRTGEHHARPLERHLEEWSAVRASTLRLMEGLPSARHLRTGIASGVSFSVRAFFWIVAGHELHHRRLFRDRYGIG